MSDFHLFFECLVRKKLWYPHILTFSPSLVFLQTVVFAGILFVVFAIQLNCYYYSTFFWISLIIWTHVEKYFSFSFILRHWNFSQEQFSCTNFLKSEHSLIENWFVNLLEEIPWCKTINDGNRKKIEEENNVSHSPMGKKRLEEFGRVRV